MKPAVERFLKDGKALIEACDEVPEAGQDYAMSVAERLESMMDWAEENDHVTEKMTNALEGWESGISKWLDRA